MIFPLTLTLTLTRSALLRRALLAENESQRLTEEIAALEPKLRTVQEELHSVGEKKIFRAMTCVAVNFIFLNFYYIFPFFSIYFFEKKCILPIILLMFLFFFFLRVLFCCRSVDSSHSVTFTQELSALREMMEKSKAELFVEQKG